MSFLVFGLLAVVLTGIVIATIRAPRLTSVLVWSLTATIFVSAALLLTLPGPFSERALWLALAVPLIWAVFQFWCYWERRAWRVAAGLISATLVGGVIVYFIDPIV